MKKGFNTLQAFLFIAIGVLLFLFFNTVNFPNSKDFGDILGLTALRVVFAICLIGVGVIFLSPKKSIGGGLSTPTHTEQTRWLWFFFGLLGAVSSGLIYLAIN